MLLYTFNHLTHHEEYKKLETCCDTVDALVQHLRQILNSPELYGQLVVRQAEQLGVASVEDYFQLFNECERECDCL